MRWLPALLVVTVVVVGSSAHSWRQERTPPTRCVPPNPCFPTRQMIASFAANITGEVYQPSDDGYVALVTGTNARLTTHPAIVVVAESENDVQKAVLFARKFHIMLTVTSANGDSRRETGQDASLEINLSRLQGITTNVDFTATTPDPGTVTAQPGVTWDQLYSAATSVNREVAGLGFPLSTYPFGEGTQAGGFGPISRSLGLASDNLLSARMVTMDGSIVDVSSAGATLTTIDGITRRTTLDPGLWHTIRGGGAGSFGIVVSYTFQMHVPPSYVTQVSASYVLYQDEQFIGRDPLKFLLPFIAALPDQWGGTIFVSGTPSATTVGRKGTVSVELVHYGAYNSATYNAISDLLNYDGNGARLSVSVVNRTNVATYVSSLDFGPFPATTRNYGFNTLLPSSVLTDAEHLDDLVDTLLLTLNNPTVDSYYACAIEPLGGAISAINSSAYVTDSLRNAAMSVACALFWPDDDAIRDEMMVSYSIDLGKRFKAFGTGTYLGQGLFEDEEDWKQSLYGENYQELLRVKIKYDIDNFLWCHNCVASDFKLDCRRGCGRGGGEGRDRGSMEERESLSMLFERTNRRFVESMNRDE